AGAEPAGGDQAGGERRAPEIEALARRLETELAAAPAEAFRPRISVEEDAGGGGNEIRALLCEAARECCRCRLRYLKPGTTEPESREVDPYVLVHATGQWYVLGHCPERDAVRAFRLDRIVAAEVLPERFEVPGDFDPAPYLEGGRVYRAEEEREVVIRYSASIARWMTERGWGLEQSDGSVVVSHRVADPGWAVRHILRYGPEAEVLAPSEIRGLVREAVRRLAG
ncbi:MAG: helix-turn-helix transcriptional regulator, partial [Gemmatimonadota bacterium]